MLQPQFQDEFVFIAQEFSSFSSGIITLFKRKVWNQVLDLEILWSEVMHNFWKGRVAEPALRKLKQ